jgi:hypothetical protein
MSIEVMRQVRNALVWNLITDLDNIPACEKWVKMLRKNIDDLDEAIADAELKWVGLTHEEESELIRLAHNHAGIRFYIQATEAKLKDKNT